MCDLAYCTPWSGTKTYYRVKTRLDNKPGYVTVLRTGSLVSLQYPVIWYSCLFHILSSYVGRNLREYKSPTILIPLYSHWLQWLVYWRWLPNGDGYHCWGLNSDKWNLPPHLCSCQDFSPLWGQLPPYSGISVVAVNHSDTSCSQPVGVMATGISV